MTGRVCSQAARQTRAWTPKMGLKPDLATWILPNRNQKVFSSTNTAPGEVIPRRGLTAHELFIKPRWTSVRFFLICCLKTYALLEKVAEYNLLKVCKKFAKLVHLDVQLGCHWGDLLYEWKWVFWQTPRHLLPPPPCTQLTDLTPLPNRCHVRTNHYSLDP